MTRRLALVGLDAADIEFIEAHLSALPTLGRVLVEGRAQRLESTARLLSGSVWPTFATGRDPGDHGLYHHQQWDASKMRFRRVTPQWLPTEPFWYGLDSHGLRSVVFDVPFSYRSRLVGGAEIVNWGAHDVLGASHARPPALLRELRRRFGRHPMGIEVPVSYRTSELRRVRDRLVRGARRKGDAAAWLADREDWDLFLTVFGESHRAGHILWPEDAGDSAVPADALLDVYRAIDAGLADLLPVLERAGAQVALFSLHGMGPNQSQAYGMPELARRFDGGAPGTGSGEGLVSRLRDRVPAVAQRIAAHMVPRQVRDLVVDRSFTGGVDWSRRRLFALVADLHGYFRLNLRGRERDGVVDPADAARVLDDFTEVLASLRDAETGSPLVRAVHRTDGLWPGPRAEILPDLVAEFEDHPAAARLTSSLGSIDGGCTTGRGGNHRARGFAVVAGESEALPVAHIADLRGWAEAVLGVSAGHPRPQSARRGTD